MSHSKACCSLPPVVSDYVATGKTEEFEGFKIYSVGPNDAKKAVIVIYDIFGYHPNTYQFCDILAKNCGWKVLLPDFLHGDFATPESLSDMPKFLEWIGRVGSLDALTPDLQRSERYLRQQGVDATGLVGFCWGAKIAVQAAAVNPFFTAVSMIHPSFVDNKDAEAAGSPILAIPSKDEPDMTEYFKILSTKPFGSKCKHVRFDDVHHGFCAARGDYTNELNVKRANEAIRLTVDFFSENFNSNKL